MRNRVIKLILINHCYNIRPLFGFLLTFGIAPIIFGHCPPLDQQQCSGACFYEDKWEKVLVLKNWTEMEKKLVHRVFTIYPYLRTHLIIICPRESFEKLRHKTHKMKFFANTWHNFLVIINAFPLRNGIWSAESIARGSVLHFLLISSSPGSLRI